MKKSDLIISKVRVFFFVFLLTIIPVSYIFNKDYDVSFNNVFMNYIVSITTLFLSLFVKEVNKYFRAILLVLSLLWFIFVTLYYLIGFHNPNWGS